VTSVAVLGGGVGGLSAAHELAERGFEVTVYEQRDAAGGKARSLPVPRSGTDGRADLPAEHGFRFFPGFYRHLPDTMERIPVGDGSAFDRLVGTNRILLAQAGGRDELVPPAHAPESLDDFEAFSRFLFAAFTQLGVPPADLAFFMERLLALLTSCEERRFGQWELQAWWDFVDAEHRSATFRKLLADGLTRTLVAARAHEISARTGGYILLQILFDLARAGGRADRVLDGPTSDVWIDPWVTHLRERGVDVRLGAPVEGIACAGRRITGATVAGETVQADYYVAALPVERMLTLLSPALRAAEPRLNGLDQLVTRWMNGIMYYLDADVPLVRGHGIYIDSPWALTSISQAQFWTEVDFSRLGDGRVEGILSIDVSDWETPAPRLGKVASVCTKEEIAEEVWAQLKDHLDQGELADANRLSWFLDPDIEFPNPSRATNAEPLLINTKGSWEHRPDAVTAIGNLMLAADYVRTYTDLATMEGANEAARRAVNGILDAERSPALRCRVWPLREPAIFKPAQWLDRVRWRLRRPPKPPLKVTEAGGLEPTGPLAARLLRRG
jgi:uncharacterized protein with NAD-binding domain and iron-sulfur cluster